MISLLLSQRKEVNWMDAKMPVTESVKKIAEFFADKYQNPQLAFQLVNCGGSCGSEPCSCECGGPVDSDGD